MPNDDLIRAEIDAYRAESAAFRAEAKAQFDLLIMRFDRLDAEVGAIAKHLFGESEGS